MGAYNTINLNDQTPATPAGKVGVKWQSVGSTHNPTIVNVSAYIDPSSISAGGPVMNGTRHGVLFNNSTALTSDVAPNSFWSHLGGTFTTFSNTSNGNQPAMWHLAASSGYASLAEDAVGKQCSFDLFQGYSTYLALDGITIANSIIWMACTDQIYTGLETATPAGNGFGIRWVKGTDTNFQCCVWASGSLTNVDSGVAADTNFHQFQFFKNSNGGIDFWIDGVKVVTINSSDPHFPSATVNLYVMVNANNTTGNFGCYLNNISWWSY